MPRSSSDQSTPPAQSTAPSSAGNGTSTGATSQTSGTPRPGIPRTADTSPVTKRKRGEPMFGIASSGSGIAARTNVTGSLSRKDGTQGDRDGGERRRIDANAQDKDSGVKRVKREESVVATEPKELKGERDVVDSDYDSITFVYIGPEVKSFGIHKGLLLKASTFFRGIFSGEYKPEAGAKSEDAVEIMSYDDGSKAITLLNEDPSIFKRFNDWLYTEKVTTRAETARDLVWNVIVDTYIFAVRRGIPRLQNSCIDVAIRKIEAGGLFPSQAIINPLWKVTGAVRPLRRLFLQLFAVKCSLKTALANNQGYCQRFLHDLVIILYEMKRDGKNGGEVDFWKARTMWYINKEDNPVAVD